jgi:hypothetical protein
MPGPIEGTTILLLVSLWLLIHKLIQWQDKVNQQENHTTVEFWELDRDSLPKEKITMLVIPAGETRQVSLVLRDAFDNIVVSDTGVKWNATGAVTVVSENDGIATIGNQGLVTTGQISAEFDMKAGEGVVPGIATLDYKVIPGDVVRFDIVVLPVVPVPVPPPVPVVPAPPALPVDPAPVDPAPVDPAPVDPATPELVTPAQSE